MGRYMVEASRSNVTAERMLSLKPGVLLGDYSFKICRNGYAGSLCAQATQHSFSLGTFSQHFPKSEAIPAACQWAPKEDIAAMALGLMTMIPVYFKVLNIDLTTCFSTVILDSNAAAQAAVEVGLRAGTLLGRDLSHSERNMTTHVSHGHTRSERKRRWQNSER